MNGNSWFAASSAGIVAEMIDMGVDDQHVFHAATSSPSTGIPLPDSLLADGFEAEPGSLICNPAFDTHLGWDRGMTIPTPLAYHRPAPLTDPSPIVPPAVSPGWVPQPLSRQHALAPAARNRQRASPYAARGRTRKYGGRGRAALRAAVQAARAASNASPPSGAAAPPFDVAAVFAATVAAPATIDDSSASPTTLCPSSADSAGTAPPVASAPSTITTAGFAAGSAAAALAFGDSPGTPQPPAAAPAAAELPKEEASMVPPPAAALAAAGAAAVPPQPAAPLKPRRKRAKKGEGRRKATAAERRRKLGANKELGSKRKALRIKWSEPWVEALVLHLRAARHPWEGVAAVLTYFASAYAGLLLTEEQAREPGEVEGAVFASYSTLSRRFSKAAGAKQM